MADKPVSQDTADGFGALDRGVGIRISINGELLKSDDYLPINTRTKEFTVYWRSATRFIFCAHLI